MIENTIKDIVKETILEMFINGDIGLFERSIDDNRKAITLKIKDTIRTDNYIVVNEVDKT